MLSGVIVTPSMIRSHTACRHSCAQRNLSPPGWFFRNVIRWSIADWSCAPRCGSIANFNSYMPEVLSIPIHAYESLSCRWYSDSPPS